MSSRHHERIRRLFAYVRQQGRAKAPLLVFEGATGLPVTPEAEIESARQAGQPILHVQFVKANELTDSVTRALPPVEIENRDLGKPATGDEFGS